MRARDQRGRYLRAANDICDFFELVFMSLKIISVGLILYFIYSYFEINESLVKFIIKKLMTKNCKLTCDKDENGGYFS